MKQITVGTYEDSSSGYSGWVEGARNDGSRWIIYFDESGSPAEFFAERDESGGVIGDAIALQ